MKYHKFKIRIYDWDVYYIEAENSKDSKRINKKLIHIGVSKKIRKIHVNNIAGGAKDGGVHIYDVHKRQSTIIIYETTSHKEKMDILCHEKRHVEDRIIDHLSLGGTEAGAFIAGYIMRNLLKVI